MKKTSIIVLTLILTSLAGCQSGNQKQNNEESGEATNQEAKPGEEQQTSPETESPQAATIQFISKSFSWDMARAVDYTGDLVAGKAWQDKNGDNLMVFSEKTTYYESSEGPGSTSIELHAYHYADAGDGYELIREVKDFEMDCGLANSARFLENLTEITDLDDDGYAEITFVYHLGCSGDISPRPQKLIMLENGEKYAIRGESILEMGPETTMGGETNIDPAFDNAPDGFLAHTKKVWEEAQLYEQEHGPEIRPYLKREYQALNNILFFGAEPNWTIETGENHFTYKPMGGESQRYNVNELIKTRDGLIIIGQQGESTKRMRMTVKEEICSDGMSENDYPYSIELVVDRKGFFGCGREK